MPASPTAITSDPDCGGEPVNGGAYTYTTRPLQHCRQRLGRQRSGTCSSSHSRQLHLHNCSWRHLRRCQLQCLHLYDPPVAALPAAPRQLAGLASKKLPGAHSTRSKLTQLAGLALAALSNAKSRESGEQTGKPF